MGLGFESGFRKDSKKGSKESFPTDAANASEFGAASNQDRIAKVFDIRDYRDRLVPSINTPGGSAAVFDIDDHPSLKDSSTSSGPEQLSEQAENLIASNEESFQSVDITNRFAELGISEETLNDIEGFSSLTDDQQEFVLYKLKETFLDSIQDKSLKEFNERRSDTNTGLLKKVWLGMSKTFQLARNQKEIAGDIFQGEHNLTESLESLTSLVAKGPDIRLEENTEGKKNFVFDIAGTNDFERDLDASEQQTLAHFNEVARSFNYLPYDTSSESFKAERTKYEEAKKDLLQIKANHLNEEELEDPDGALNTYENKLDGTIAMNQFFNANPDVEDRIMQIQNEPLWRQTFKNMIDPKGPASSNLSLFAGGFGLRAFATGALGASSLIVAPVVGAAVGAMRGRLTAREELAENELQARYGKEWSTAEHIKKRSKKEQSEARNFMKAESLIEILKNRTEAVQNQQIPFKIEDADALDKQIDELKDLSGRTPEQQQLLDDLKRQRKALLSPHIKLLTAITYAEVKLRDNLVSFKDVEASRKEQFDVFTTLEIARNSVMLPKDRTEFKQKSQKVNGFFHFRNKTIDSLQEDFVDWRTLKGLTLGASFASIGATVATYGGRLLESVVSSAHAGPATDAYLEWQAQELDGSGQLAANPDTAIDAYLKLQAQELDGSGPDGSVLPDSEASTGTTSADEGAQQEPVVATTSEPAITPTTPEITSTLTPIGDFVVPETVLAHGEATDEPIARVTQALLADPGTREYAVASIDTLHNPIYPETYIREALKLYTANLNIDATSLTPDQVSEALTNYHEYITQQELSAELKAETEAVDTLSSESALKQSLENSAQTFEIAAESIKQATTEIARAAANIPESEVADNAELLAQINNSTARVVVLADEVSASSSAEGIEIKDFAELGKKISTLRSEMQRVFDLFQELPGNTSGAEQNSAIVEAITGAQDDSKIALDSLKEVIAIAREGLSSGAAVDNSADVSDTTALTAPNPTQPDLGNTAPPPVTEADTTSRAQTAEPVAVSEHDHQETNQPPLTEPSAQTDDTEPTSKPAVVPREDDSETPLQPKPTYRTAELVPLKTETVSETAVNIGNLLEEINSTPDYNVQPGDSVWKIIPKKLEAHDSFRALPEAQRTKIIELLQNKSLLLSQAEKDAFVGRSNVNINLIYKDDQLNFNALLQNKDVVAGIEKIINEDEIKLADFDINRKVQSGDTFSDYLKDYVKTSPKVEALKAEYGQDTVFKALVLDAEGRDAEALRKWGFSGDKASEIYANKDVIAVNYTPEELREIVSEYVEASNEKTMEVAIQPEAHPTTTSTEAELETLAVEQTEANAVMDGTSADHEKNTARTPQPANLDTPVDTIDTLASLSPDELNVGVYAPEPKDFTLAHKLENNTVEKYFSGQTLPADWAAMKDEPAAKILAKLEQDFGVFTGKETLALSQTGSDSPAAVTKAQEMAITLFELTRRPIEPDETMGDFVNNRLAYLIERAEQDFGVIATENDSLDSLLFRMVKTAHSETGLQLVKNKETEAKYLLRAYAQMRQNKLFT